MISDFFFLCLFSFPSTRFCYFLFSEFFVCNLILKDSGYFFFSVSLKSLNIIFRPRTFRRSRILIQISLKFFNFVFLLLFMIGSDFLSIYFCSWFMIHDGRQILYSSPIFMLLLCQEIFWSVCKISIGWNVLDKVFTSFILIKVVVPYFYVVLCHFPCFFNYAFLNSHFCLFIWLFSLPEELFYLGFGCYFITNSRKVEL